MYPDVSVVCGEALFEDDEDDTLLNPKVIVEELFRSTEPYDRGDKFENYQRLSSLRQYVLLPSDRSTPRARGRVSTQLARKVVGAALALGAEPTGLLAAAGLTPELLAEAELSLAEVAFALGFAEQSAFRRWVGTTPAEWRRARAAGR